MIDLESEAKLVKRLRNDRGARVVAAGVGLLFLVTGARFASFMGYETRWIEESPQEFKIMHLQSWVIGLMLSTAFLLAGSHFVLHAIIGNPVGKLAVRLWERVRELERKSEATTRDDGKSAPQP